MRRTFRSPFVRLVAGAWLATSVNACVAAEWAVDADHVSIYFAASHFDISYVHGRFAKITAAVQFDPDAKTGQAVVTVDADSIDTGNRTLDGILRSSQFLDTVANPEIRYVSSQFVFAGDRLVAVDGTVWLHGVQRPLRLDAERFTCKDVAAGIVSQHRCGGAFHAVLKRSEFGMTRFLPDVGDDIKLDIGVEATRR